jgi:hypothetical protein
VGLGHAVEADGDDPEAIPGVIRLRITLRGDQQPALGPVEQMLGHASRRDRPHVRPLGRSQHDQVGLAPLGQRLQGIRRRALLHVDDLELAPIALDDPLSQLQRVLAGLGLLVADDDLRIDGRRLCHQA